MMGREGDWECSGCGNRNYAFRCFCNRCKVPRLLVDNKTPPDSKWLPRIGDWICTGCTNNNYASREMCKKCGQPKEVAAMPAVAIPGASLPTHPTYFARAQYESRPADRYSLLQASTWSSVGNGRPGVPFVSQGNQPLPASNGWRNGDWFCRCGFHNYSSRTQCKKCNGSAPPAPSPSPLVNTAITALGTKRLASEELIHDWDNKRLNLGQQAYPYPGAERMWGSGGNQLTAIATTLPSGNSMMLPKQVNLQIPHVPAAPTLIGKGAKQWRDGDWMCTNCNNHNYASRSNCNRCKTERNAPAQPVSVA